MANLRTSIPVSLDAELRRYLLERDGGAPSHAPRPIQLSQPFVDYDLIEWSQAPAASLSEVTHDLFCVWWAEGVTATPDEGCAILPGEARKYSRVWPLGAERSYAIQAGRVTHRGIEWTVKVQIDDWRGVL